MRCTHLGVGSGGRLEGTHGGIRGADALVALGQAQPKPRVAGHMEAVQLLRLLVQLKRPDVVAVLNELKDRMRIGSIEYGATEKQNRYNR